MPYQGDAKLPRMPQHAKPLLASPCAACVVARTLTLFFSIEWLCDISSYPLSSSLAHAIATAKDEQVGPNHAKAKSTVPSHFQRNYSRQVLVWESYYHLVLSNLQLSSAKLQLVVSLATELLRPSLAEADGKLNP